jgi:hypothetical protein
LWPNPSENPSHEKRRFHGKIRALSFVSESPPGGSMRQQTKPFIVERKPSRKLASDTSKPSIWGKLDLTLNDHHHVERGPVEATTAGGDDDRH